MTDANGLDGLDLRTLRPVLADAVDLAGPLEATLISGGKSNLTFILTDGRSRWILRRPPLGDVPAGAHDVSREHRVMSALLGSAVPVPTVRLLCRDAGVIGAPFYVMDEVPGQVARTVDDVRALPTAVRGDVGRALVDTLAELHEIDPAEVGLHDLGRPDGYLERQLGRWRRQYQQVCVRDLPQVETVARRLADQMPVSPRASVVHGDYRLDNVILAPDARGRIAAVLDWEMATLGDPLADLATFLMFHDEPGRPFNPISGGLTAEPGFPSRDEVVQRYAERRGIAVDHLDWYLVFAAFRLAVILEQIHTRHLAGRTRGEGFEGVGDMVLDLLDGCTRDLGVRS